MTSASRCNKEKMCLCLTNMPNACEPQFYLAIGVGFGEPLVANIKNMRPDRAAKLSTPELVHDCEKDAKNGDEYQPKNHNPNQSTGFFSRRSARFVAKPTDCEKADERARMKGMKKEQKTVIGRAIESIKRNL